MKQFFISFFATIAGIIVSALILTAIIMGVITAMVSASSKEKELTVKTNSVLQIKLDHAIPERSSKSPFKNFDFTSLSAEKEIGLNDIINNIKKAKEDNNIKGIYLDLSSISAGVATLEEIRNALIDFKISGKFIISYSESYTQGTYYLASTADKIYLNPQGSVEWKGLTAQIMFYKGTLEKLEIDAQIFRHGKFKSAIEPFDLNKMSAANRQQTMTYISSIWNHIVEGVSKIRKISIEELNKIADNLLIQTAQDAIEYKLADELKYKDELLADLRKRLALKENAKINFVDFGAYSRAPEIIKRIYPKEKIAVIYATGTIISGEGDDESIGSENLSETIRDARLDNSIKAIVLRVNSPGGSALASDVIWREIVLAQKTKPVVVSMGDVAASGGYYISCAADAIVAQPNTITGSIGVYGILPNAQKFFNNKLGITIDTVKTNKHSDIGSIFRAVSPEEGVVIQKSIENVYTVFIENVAKGRHMTPAEVDSIGQGRVWSGVDAKKIGLVDELGGIKTAINIAAKKAKIDNYRIIDLPKQKDPFEKFFGELIGNVQASFMKKELGENYTYYKHLKEVLDVKGIQARMPYDVIIY